MGNDTWCKFYADNGLCSNHFNFDDKDIGTEYTALMSQVMSNGNGRIKFLSMNLQRKKEIPDRRIHRLLQRSWSSAHSCSNR